MPWVPVTDPNELAAARAELGLKKPAAMPAAPKPTEDQAKSAGFYLQMQEAAKAMNEAGKYSPSEVDSALDESGFLGGIFRRAIPAKEQRVLNAQRAFTNAVMRTESGAAIAPSEFVNRIRILFPQPNDGPDAQRDKEQQREAAINAMRLRAGPALPPNTPRLPARVRNDADYNRLPKGASYIGPDGITRIK